MWSILIAIIFEIAVLLFAVSVTAKHVCRKDAEFSIGKFCLSLVLLRTLAVCGINELICFLHLVYPLTYILISLGLLSCAVFSRQLIATLIHDLKAQNKEKWMAWAVAGLCLVFTPLLMICIHPIWDGDSSAVLSHALNWVTNKTNPYDNWFLYVSFWEQSFLHLYALGHSEIYFWWQDFWAILAFGFAIYEIAGELKLDKKLSLALVAHGLAYFLIWLDWSGPSTLKNDIAYDAGLLVLLLAYLRMMGGKYGRYTFLLLAWGIVFAIVKYSGPVIVVSTFLLFLAVQKWIKKESISQSLRYGLLAGLAALLFDGHTYLHHLIVYGNPFYPVAMEGLHLPGYFHIKGTALMNHIRDSEMWTYLFGLNRSPPILGFLYVLTLPMLALSGCVLLKSRQIAQRADFLMVGLFGVASFLLFMNSFTSAGPTSAPSDLIYIAGWHALRFASAAVTAMIIAIVAAVYWWAPKLRPILFGAVIVDFFVRLYGICTAIRFSNETILFTDVLNGIPLHVVTHLCVVLAAFLIVCLWWRYKKTTALSPLLIPVLFLVVLLLETPTIFSHMTKVGPQDFSHMYQITRQPPDAPVFVVSKVVQAPDLDEVIDTLCGVQIRSADPIRRVDVGDETTLSEALARGEGAPLYIVLSVVIDPVPSLAEKTKLLRDILQQAGYEIVYDKPRMVVWGRQ